MIDNLIDIRNINFSFPNNPIFSDFSYAFNKNEIITIVGNSGCGKSTLLNLVSGLLEPASGNISVNDSLAFLTQHLTLLPYHTAYENTLLACELRNAKTEQKEKEANDLFKLFNLSEISKNKFPQELSGGMRQRIGLIQTLLVDVQIYLLDEPFKEIDRGTWLVVQDYIWHKFKKNQSLGIIITHDIEHALLMGDKVLFLSVNNPMEELVFNKDFASLSPDKRLKTDYYDKYMLYIIKKLGELK
jgi:NitT/TauT family transport system ATP-binding protein/putative hydroxymethylpyrimidine transport system ATP-binding protein